MTPFGRFVYAAGMTIGGLLLFESVVLHRAWLAVAAATVCTLYAALGELESRSQ